MFVSAGPDTRTRSTRPRPARPRSARPLWDGRSRTPGRPAAGRTGRWAVRYARRLAITDFLTVAWAAIGAHTIQFRDLPSEAPSAAGSSALIALTATLAVLWLGALQLGSTREPSMIGKEAPLLCVGDDAGRPPRAAVVEIHLAAMAARQTAHG